MKNKSISFSFSNRILAVFVVLITIAGCTKEEPKAVNEEELITTVVLAVQKSGSATVDTFIYNDPDGVGGASATLDSIILDKNAIYNAAITLLNVTATPVDTISHEVLEEGVDHQFFYSSTPDSVFNSFTYQGATDANGRPIGLQFRFNTNDLGGSGKFKIILRHQPDKAASGVSGGDITNANGETDVEVEFPVRLQ